MCTGVDFVVPLIALKWNICSAAHHLLLFFGRSWFLRRHYRLIHRHWWLMGWWLCTAAVAFAPFDRFRVICSHEEILCNLQFTFGVVSIQLFRVPPMGLIKSERRAEIPTMKNNLLSSSSVVRLFTFAVWRICLHVDIRIGFLDLLLRFDIALAYCSILLTQSGWCGWRRAICVSRKNKCFFCGYGHRSTDFSLSPSPSAHLVSRIGSRHSNDVGCESSGHWPERNRDPYRLFSRGHCAAACTRGKFAEKPKQWWRRARRQQTGTNEYQMMNSSLPKRRVARREHFNTSSLDDVSNQKKAENSIERRGGIYWFNEGDYFLRKPANFPLEFSVDCRTLAIASMELLNYCHVHNYRCIELSCGVCLKNYLDFVCWCSRIGTGGAGERKEEEQLNRLNAQSISANK